MKPHVELLAPAGSMESMVAAVNAGADAVYMGGSRFGARAYADNPEEDKFLQAIDYAHLHGCRLYMTVNTLVKEEELSQVEDFLKPYYRQGLDAAIVQDMGVFALIRHRFPKLPVHASTQMTVTGHRMAKMLKNLGATRVVTARELSLEEIARIHQEVDIEIESFIHGALCYCYSGQCLLSSLIGGRSGNRGRCAQPCRLPYGLQRGKKENKSYLLSLKDLCTLDILPDIIESGVYSLKIEGRMKSARYTAGVVSVYRKYVDLYCAEGREGYHVFPEDRDMLRKLFDRGGYTDGYYHRHNGRDMIALKEKPSFREVDQALFDRLDNEYVNKKKQEALEGELTVRQGEALCLKLKFPAVTIENRASDGEKPVDIVVTGQVAETAQNQPLTKERLFKQMNKTGDSPFYFRQLEIELSGSCFLPVQALNELRRQGMAKMEQAILQPYRRVCEEETDKRSGQEILFSQQGELVHRPSPCIHVALETSEGLKLMASHPNIDEIYLDAGGFSAKQWKGAAKICHQKGKKCALILPYIFRDKAEQYFQDHIEELKNAGFDELVLRSMEEAEFLREEEIRLPMVFDANLYAMNHLAAFMMVQAGASRLTLPLELNGRELGDLCSRETGCQGWEAVVYGYLPAMVSAQCIQSTVEGCSRQPRVRYVRDRTGQNLPVKNFCQFCYNVLYNPKPLFLLGQEHLADGLRGAVLRIQFSLETPQQMQEVVDQYAGYFCQGKAVSLQLDDFTRGHWKRGVE